ncbi:MAG: tetratricopeptide repeat protein [Planctomycetota bacterium]
MVRANKLREAEAVYGDGLIGELREMLGPRHPAVLEALNSYGRCLMLQTRLDEAEGPLTESFRISRDHAGPDHPNTLYFQDTLAVFYLTQGRPEDGFEQFGDLLDIHAKKVGLEHPATFRILSLIFDILQRPGMTDQILPFFEQVVARHVDELGPRHPRTLEMRRQQGLGLLATGQIEQAEEILRDCLTIAEEIEAADSPNIREICGNLGWCLTVAERFEDAQPYVRRGEELAALRRSVDPKSYEQARQRTDRFYESWSKPQGVTWRQQ